MKELLNENNDDTRDESLIITKASVGLPQEPDYDYEVDDWYDINKGFDPKINYSSLKTITPEMSKRLWKEIDKEMLHEMRYFAHNVQRVWEVRYECVPESAYVSPEPALDLDVEYFGFWATADDRLRYICDNIVTNPKCDLIDQIGNGLASHFYGARNIHQSMTNETDPKKALVDYTRLAQEQLDYKKTGVVGKYTLFLREFLETQKKRGVKFWGTTELHTSIQTAARRWRNDFYLGDRMHAEKGTTNNVNEWMASFKNSGLMQKMLDNSGLKSMCEILGTEWGIGDYYMFHGGSDLSLCPQLNAYLDERFVIPGPGATNVVRDLYPNLAKSEISYADRIIWLRENQERLLGLPLIHEFFHTLVSNGQNIFPEKINEIKTTQAEVLHCQFGIFRDLKANPDKISKRKISRNTDEISCLIDSKALF